MPNEVYLYQPQVPQGDAVSIGWCYPYTYGVSMSSLGYLTLFRDLDRMPHVSAKRVNTDNMHQFSASDFELMGFSFSFELDILEMLRMFGHFKLPLYAADRTRDMPLLFAGGPVVMTNPEPYAPFYDFFVIGEGEEVLAEVVKVYQKYRHLTDRRAILLALASEVPGVYVPEFIAVDYEPQGAITGFTPQYESLPFPIEKRLISDMNPVVSSTPILTPESVFSNTFIVEVMRGCAHRCRFCLASYSMLPARGPTLDQIIQQIEAGLAHTNKIGLLGALISEHPDFEALCTYLRGKDGIEVSAASLRADTMTPTIAETFKQCQQNTVTLAVETGSERLRKRINKHLKTEAILEAAGMVAAAGIEHLKLYTMIGLPDETQPDLEETVALVRQIKKAHPRLNLIVGCSTFVPKAATPFQWVSREETKTLQDKHEYLRKSLVKLCRFRPSSPKWDYVQALLSRGDRRLAEFLVEFAQQGANLGALRRTLKQLDHAIDLPALDWYALRERPITETLPWDLLFLGVQKPILYKESGLAQQGQPSQETPITPTGR